MGGSFSKGDRIPIEKAREIIEKMHQKRLWDLFYRAEIAGSFRREKISVGDIEIVVIPEDDYVIQGWFKKHSEVKIMGDERISALVDGVQIDVEITNAVHWGAALLYFTGSVGFNIKMRSFAKSFGFTLNQRGLYLGEEKVASISEEDIFEKLGIKFIEPRNRDQDVRFEITKAADPHKHFYRVKSKSSGNEYQVMIWDDGTAQNGTCNCPHYVYRCKKQGIWCKHAEKVLQEIHHRGKKSNAVVEV